MTIRIAINGYGRIGRNVTRALYESGLRNQIELVAINDLGDLPINLHLTKYDSVHGHFHGDVSSNGNFLVINGDKIRVFSEHNPESLPWKELEIDVAIESTGLFASKEKACAHLTAGAKKVLISAPAGKDLPTIVYGVNDQTLKTQDLIVSNSSCTTNCLVPIAKVLHDSFGFQSGLMVTVHAYTNDQNLMDGYHTDLRRSRSATQSMIPTKTGAVASVNLVLPELSGKLDGYAIRVPTINVSMIDLSFEIEKDVSVNEINAAMKNAADDALKGILQYSDQPLVSIDFNHNPSSSIFDSTQTKKINGLYKVVSWYDNEWGFSNRMLNTVVAMMEAK